MENNRKELIDATEVGKYLSILYRHNRIYIDNNLNDEEFGSGQHTFVFFLKNRPGATQEEISRALDIDKATTARAIQKLESHGYVTRQSDLIDRRVNHVYLTQAGDQLYTRVKTSSNQWKAIVLEAFSAEEIIALEASLKKLAHNSILYRHKKEGTYDGK